jgi:hypothetical protein
MHRSLLWGVSALKYYLSIQNEYKYSSITADTDVGNTINMLVEQLLTIWKSCRYTVLKKQ